MSSTVKLKTITSFVNDINTHRIFDHMTKISKNIYNATIFCTTIFMKYKQSIFEEIYKQVKLRSIDNMYGKLEIETKIYELYELRYKSYIENVKLAQNNNYIIYIFIKNIMNTVCLVNDNYEIIREIVIYNILNNKNVRYTDENKKEMVIDIVDGILVSIYNKNYYQTKTQLMNRIPITIQNAGFINQVKNEEYIIKTKKKINWKNKINNIISQKLVSDNNIIGRIVYRHIDNDIYKLPSDIIINIIQKAYQGYISYYALKQKGIKCNMPKYLNKNDHYNIPFFQRSMKIETKNGKPMIRLTVGKYVSSNYCNIIKNQSLICVNHEENTEYKKYVSYSKLLELIKKIPKTNNYIFDDLCKYISKKNKNLIDSYYVYIDLPYKIIKNNIKYIEIKPLYENFKHKICIIYEDIQNDIQMDTISVDLGIKSLMTIYDPTGKQIIIDGNYLNWLNKSYNHKIDKLKQLAKSLNNVNITNQIRNLLIDRENKINNHFNCIVKWLTINYSNKKLIIIGYNKNWKPKVNLDNKTNRKFYQIPYCKLLNKLTNKMLQIGIIVKLNEESYTSKCDALAFEKVGFHEKYLGKRIRRGLFSSNTDKLINADLNGAINIMRKFFEKQNHTIETLTGINLYNPVRANILCEVINQQSKAK